MNGNEVSRWEPPDPREKCDAAYLEDSVIRIYIIISMYL